MPKPESVTRCNTTKSFTVPRPEQWFKLPLKLRQRWWAETNYGREQPNTELKEAVDEYIRSNESS